MTNGPGLTRLLVGALALATIAGCSGKNDFEIRERYRIQGTGSVSASEDVNLADVAGDAWDHRDKINDVKVTSAVATITAVAPANTAPSGTVVAEVGRGSGAGQESAEVLNGSGAIAVGTRLEGRNLDAASGILKRAIDGDGLLSVQVDATIPEGTAADFTVEVVLQVEADWSLF